MCNGGMKKGLPGINFNKLQANIKGTCNERLRSDQKKTDFKPKPMDDEVRSAHLF